MKIQIKNRYNKLKEVILCYPTEFKVKNKKIDKNLMFNQYNNFINKLQSEGIKTYFLDPKYGTSQVYTRDIGFVIDDILFISKMTPTERREEYKALEKFIKNKSIKIKRLNNFIEGGDVIIHDNKIFIGLSRRTTLDGINELKHILNTEHKKYIIFPIKFNNKEMLHLDCVFNVLSKDSCLITDHIYNIDIIKNTFKKCYYIKNEESKRLATNILTLGNDKIICSNKNVCDILSKDGFKITYIEFSEIIKGEGAFTCVTLPIYSK